MNRLYLGRSCTGAAVGRRRCGIGAMLFTNRYDTVTVGDTAGYTDKEDSNTDADTVSAAD